MRDPPQGHKEVSCSSLPCPRMHRDAASGTDPPHTDTPPGAPIQSKPPSHSVSAEFLHLFPLLGLWNARITAPALSSETCPIGSLLRIIRASGRKVFSRQFRFDVVSRRQRFVGCAVCIARQHKNIDPPKNSQLSYWKVSVQHPPCESIILAEVHGWTRGVPLSPK